MSSSAQRRCQMPSGLSKTLTEGEGPWLYSEATEPSLAQAPAPWASAILSRLNHSLQGPQSTSLG